MPSEFGIFAPMFASAHGYLALLGLRSADSSDAVARVRECCRRAADPFPDICRLLVGANWRPHLVASVAVITSGYHEESVSLLWQRLDGGSWVTPQIAVSLSLTDPQFTERARERLESRCLIATGDLGGMSPVERHSAAGPAGSVARSAKAAHTLIHLVRMRAPDSAWLHDLLAAPDFKALLAGDIDGSGGITDDWRQRITAILFPNGGKRDA